jgi:hypothetical protein
LSHGGRWLTSPSLFPLATIAKFIAVFAFRDTSLYS